MIALASLFLIVVVILIVARIATVALVATGLPYELARFQARSALTGVGFTTSESESIVGHPVRRRIVMVLMLVGNAGFVSLIASVMLSFSSNNPDVRDVFFRLSIAVGGLLTIALIARSRAFERRFTAIIANLVDRFTDLELRDYHHLLQLSNDYAVTELGVKAGDWLADKSLANLELPDEGILVLAVQRANGSFIGAPRGDTVIEAGDTVVLYGRSAILSDLDDRPDTPSGAHAHIDAVAEHMEIMANQWDSQDD